MDAFLEGLDAVFADENFGEAATYMPPSGAVVACRIIRRDQDRDVRFGGGHQIAQGFDIEVRRSEVATPRKGDVFFGVATAQYLRVVADPEITDPDRLVWNCRVAAVAPFTPSLDFADPRNSAYVALFEDA